MLIAALRDLQWRRRRFLIAIGGTALVFGLTLVMTGVSTGFDTEARATVRDLEVDGWVVKSGASGPFLGASPLLQTERDVIAALPGVEAAEATLFTRKSVESGGEEIDVNIFGGVAGSVGLPAPDRGRAPEAAGEVMVSSRLPGYDIDDTLEIASHQLRIVGEVRDSTALAGTPNVFVTVADAQAIGFGSQPIASAIAVRGLPSSLPDGFELSLPYAARADLLRAIAKAKSTIALITALLWIVAASIIGAVVYLTALERQRDFAVFKATGVATRSILGGLALQAALLSVIAALLGSVVATGLGPQFPMIVSIELQSHLLLPLVAIVVGLVASLAGLRRVVAVDPVLAFGGP